MHTGIQSSIVEFSAGKIFFFLALAVPAFDGTLFQAKLLYILYSSCVYTHSQTTPGFYFHSCKIKSGSGLGRKLTCVVGVGMSYIGHVKLW